MSDEEKVLHFMVQANRPYAVQGVADMLATQGVRKAGAQRALEALAAAGKLTSKEFGKAKLYWKPQPAPGEAASDGASPAGIAAATARAAALNEELAGVVAENARLVREVAAAAAAPSPASVAERSAAAEAALPDLQARLAAATAPPPGAPPGAPVLDKATVEKDLAAAVAAWARNRGIFQRSFDAVTENMDGNVKNVLAEIGVETDKDAGVDLSAMKALVAGCGGKGGGGGGMKRGRA